MRYLPAALLTSLLIIGAGCFQSPEPTVLPDQPEREPENMVGDVQVETVEIKKEFVLNEFAECRVHISYPQFPGGAVPSNAAYLADQAMAEFIAKALNSSEEIPSTYDLDRIAENHLDECRVEIEREYSALSSSGEDLFTNLKRTIDIVYNIKINEFHLLTVGLDEYAYTGGAHPNQDMLYLNIDRGGDRLLTLQDIINPEHLKVFLQYEKAQLLANHRDNLYPEITEEYDALIENQSSLTAEQQVELYGQVDNFYLTPTSIVTYYNTYEIAPYAAGPIYVEIPFADVKDYISMNGPLVPLVENL